MPRILYNDEKIYGTPIETDLISLANLEKIFENSPKLEKTLKFSGNDLGYFRYFSFIHGGQFYSNRTIYLPKQVHFWDMPEYSPSDFFFLVIINEKIELRMSKGTGSHVQVTDKKIIKKIETTIKAMLKHISEVLKIKGIKLDNKLVENFIEILNLEKHFSKDIVEMAYSPTDYFDNNKKILKKYDILDPSENMYLLYLVSILEEKNIVRMVDWKESFRNIVSCVKSLDYSTAIDIDDKKYKRETAGKILFAISGQIEKETNKVIFCIDTNSDSYSFGIIEKKLLGKIMEIGKKINIEVYQPKE